MCVPPPKAFIADWSGYPVTRDSDGNDIGLSIDFASKLSSERQGVKHHFECTDSMLEAGCVT